MILFLGISIILLGLRFIFHHRHVRELTKEGLEVFTINRTMNGEFAMRTGATGMDYFTCIKCGKLVAEKMFDY